MWFLAASSYIVLVPLTTSLPRPLFINFFWYEMDNLDSNDMWFEIEGAICYVAYVTFDSRNKQIEGMVISRGCNVNLPAKKIFK